MDTKVKMTNGANHINIDSTFGKRIDIQPSHKPKRGFYARLMIMPDGSYAIIDGAKVLNQKIIKFTN